MAGKLAPERVVSLMIDLLSTLSTAHRNGVRYTATSSPPTWSSCRTAASR